jgi:hypothetical protein
VSSGSLSQADNLGSGTLQVSVRRRGGLEHQFVGFCSSARFLYLAGTVPLCVALPVTKVSILTEQWPSNLFMLR